MPVFAQSPDGPFHPVTLNDTFEHPWSIAILPDGGFLVTERGGTLYRLSAHGEDKQEIDTGLNIVSRRQGGLLDVVLHPDFESNRLVYLSYVARGYGGTGTEVARGTLIENELQNVEVIFKAEPKVRSDVHFGSRLLFNDDGYLFITLGERFQMDRAQELSSHHGTVVRLYDDGRVPADNPFVGQDNKRPEIYSYGHRNVQGIAKQPGTNRIWIHEHGPQGGDEVNILKPGANYGWPVITYGIDYDDTVISERTHAPGMEQPVIYWSPSIAPSGMTFYNGDKFPQFKGDLFVGALVLTHLRQLDVEDENITGQKTFFQDLARIRDVESGPDGFIYILTDETDGRLIRLTPSK